MWLVQAYQARNGSAQMTAVLPLAGWMKAVGVKTTGRSPRCGNSVLLSAQASEHIPSKGRINTPLKPAAPVPAHKQFSRPWPLFRSASGARAVHTMQWLMCGLGWAAGLQGGQRDAHVGPPQPPDAPGVLPLHPARPAAAAQLGVRRPGAGGIRRPGLLRPRLQRYSINSWATSHYISVLRWRLHSMPRCK